MNQSIKILAGNIQGAHKDSRLRFGLKQAYIDADEPNVILANETWTDDDFFIHEKFAHHQNNVDWEDGSNGIGQGQSVYVEKNRPHTFKNYSKRLQLLQLINIVNIIHLYAPQVGKNDLEKNAFYSDLSDLIGEITNDRPIIAVGDYNIDIKELPNSYLKDFGAKGKIINTGQATQKYGRELDYAIIFNKNDELQFHSNAELVSLPTSDHEAIAFTIKYNENNFRSSNNEKIIMEDVKPRQKIPIPTSTENRLKFKKLFRDRWKRFLNENGPNQSILKSNSINLCRCKNGKHKQLLDENYKKLREILIKTAQDCTPERKKKKILHKTQNDKFLLLYENYKNGIIEQRTFKRKLKVLQIQSNKKYFIHMSQHIKNSKNFFRLAKARLNADKKDCQIKKMPFQNIVSMYSKIFEPEEVTKKDILDLRKKYNKINSNTVFNPFTINEVRSAFDKIHRKKASRGPVIELWAMTGDYETFTELFNSFTRHGHLPAEFLTAEIFMLKKCHLIADNDCTNYRPISLIESLSKVYEMLIKDRIPWDITKYQYAYQRNIGTLNAVKDFKRTANENLQNSGQSLNCFLDMSKAFDKLSIKSTMNRLEPLLQDDLPTLRMLSVLLTNATSIINENYTLHPRCGIRQGSIISPFLFLQCCNTWLHSIGSKIGGTLKAFADDIALQSASFKWIQAALDSFSSFCRDNNLLANPKKSGFIIMLNSRKYDFFAVEGRRIPKLYLDDEEIKMVTSYKYLGYHMSGNNSDKKHLKEIFSKFRKKALNMRRYLKGCDDKQRVYLIKSFLLSTLYGLEFTPNLNDHFKNRYNYIMSIAFGIETSKINQKYEKFPELRIEQIMVKTRRRHENIKSRYGNITL